MNLLTALLLAQTASAQLVPPVLAFPEPGVDDSVAYEGYRTRFVRDAAGNAVQIYINQREGRVVHLWADAANASAAFTARDADGRPAALTWGSDSLLVGGVDGKRFVEYRLTGDPAPVEIGAFLLGSMRLERDFQYLGRHLLPFPEATIEQPELLGLIAHLERLDAPERRRQLALLDARDPGEVRGRLRHILRHDGGDGQFAVRVEQPTFDGRNLLALELRVEDGRATADAARGTITVHPRDGRPIRLFVRIATDHGTLTPLGREQIFNADFFDFYDRVREESAGAVAAEGGSTGSSADALRFRRLERQVRSLELASYEEKLMAGLPNYATYFGRDMIMSALMMEPIWSAAMLEHVIASVLRKLAPTGAVSHEEALGGQAIREHAAVYNGLMAEHFRALEGGEAARADSLLARARTVLGRLQETRENYHMVDDDFQFPVLVARYLGNPDIGRERKRAFLLAAADGAADGAADDVGASRLERLLRNLAFVARRAESYARDPVPENLIGFQRRADGRWYASSWRDSGAGYANGRFAMDVNVIWVPEALAAMERIFAGLAAAGFPVEELAAEHAGPDLDAAWAYARDRARLRAALETWRGARGHFVVELDPAEVRTRVAAWLDDIPDAETRAYWAGVAEEVPVESEGVRFLALALDSIGRPIPVANTDPAMQLFLEDMTGRVLGGEYTAEQVLAEVEPFALEYPLGLFVPGLGPLVANDAYASPEVWRAFREDLYHSPSVVWGREVNLLKLGLARQIAAAFDDGGRLQEPGLEAYAGRLAEVLDRTVDAVEASGLKDNELWTYRIEGGRLFPLRYGTSTDVQLWNLTDLAVQYVLSRLPAPARLSGAPGGRALPGPR